MPAVRTFAIPDLNWRRSVLATNNLIYSAQYDATSNTIAILEIDPTDDSWTVYPTWTPVPSSNRSVGLCIATSGSVYFQPGQYYRLIKFDVSAKTWAWVNLFSLNINLSFNSQAVDAGRLYGWARSLFTGSPGVDDFNILNTATDTWTWRESQLPTRSYIVSDGIVANSKLFAPWHDSVTVSGGCVVVNSTTNTYAGEFSLPMTAGTGPWRSPVLAPDGLIYLVRYNGDNVSVLSIDPATETPTIVATEPGGPLFGPGPRNGVLAPDGLIYWAAEQRYVSFDPATSTITGHDYLPGYTFRPDTGAALNAAGTAIYLPGGGGYCNVIDLDYVRRRGGRGIGLGRGPRMISTS